MNINDLQNITANFVQELKHSDIGKKTSLAYIKNTITSSPLANKSEIFQIMVIGGTVFKNVLVEKKLSNINLLEIKQNNLPIFSNKKIFLKFISENIDPNIETLVINFAYPLKPILRDGKLDGMLTAITKENSFRGLLNQNIGEAIENYYQNLYQKKLNVYIANDSVCLFLSGLTKYKTNEIAAGIVGSGVNFCISSNQNTIINLESGNFNKFNPKPSTLYIDSQSKKKKKSLFEKEVAGIYLYKHFNYLIDKKGVKFNKLINTAQLNDLARDSSAKFSLIAKKILAHSAQLVACKIAGITKFKKNNMIFIMQGSLFWKGLNYKETVEKTVKKLAPEFTINFINIDDSDIFGAIKLVT